MKNLKYIKLFEAFESSKISKTLSFINKSSREKFIHQLKTISGSIDFPVSELSDDFLQYLPFNKALELNANLEDTPCTGDSKTEFSGYGIEGEKCIGGLIKRKWGRSIRTVACTHCGGTGIEPKTNFPIKWIKFWFDKDGNYILTGATDGKIRTQSDDLKSIKISQNISSYDVVKELTNSELLSLQNGDYVKIKLNHEGGRTVIGRVFRGRRADAIYIIQDFCSGSEPDYTRDWKKYGKYSWVVQTRNGEYSGVPTLLIPKTDDKKEDEKPNPYTWNALLGRNNSVTSDLDMKTKLSNAHFAIVLDYLELTKSKYRLKSDIQKQRQERTKDTYALLSDEEIRQANINKYIEEINKRVQFSSDFSNVSNLVFRLFGLGKFGFYVIRGRHFNDFDTILTYMYRFLQGSDEGEQQFYYLRIVDSLKPKIKANIQFNKEVEDVMSSSFKDLPEWMRPLKSKLEELNTAIFNKFKSLSLENIEDLEVFFEKMKSLRSLWRESQRFELLKNTLYYPVEHLSDSYRFERYMSQIGEDQLENIIKGLDRFISVVNKI